MDLTGASPVQPNYWIEMDEHGERLVIPIRRGWKPVILTIGAFVFTAALALRGLDNDDQLERILHLGTFGLGTLVLLASVLTSLFGREVLAVKDGNLVHGWQLFGLGRKLHFEVSHIRLLAADRDLDPPDLKQLVNPLRDFGKLGVVKFDYAKETQSIGAALTVAEGQQVVAWLIRRLPRGATDY